MSRATLSLAMVTPDSPDRLLSLFHLQDGTGYTLSLDGNRFGPVDGDPRALLCVALVHFPDAHPMRHGVVPGYYEQSWFAYAMGWQYAMNGITGGETAPQESPLSGEWSGDITPRDIIERITGPVPDASYGSPAFEQAASDWSDEWENGYYAAFAKAAEIGLIPDYNEDSE